MNIQGFLERAERKWQDELQSFTDRTEGCLATPPGIPTTLNEKTATVNLVNLADALQTHLLESSSTEAMSGNATC